MTIVETVVAIAIFAILATVAYEIYIGVDNLVKRADQKSTALWLAEEGIEATRSIRDEAFANLTDGTYGLSDSGNKWVLSGSSDMSGIYERAVNISTISPVIKEIITTVNWSSKTSPTNSVSLKSYLTNWHQVNYNSGLTVDKLVINHGQSKVKADFAPYTISITVGTTTTNTEVVVGVANQVIPGTYTVTETEDSNYTKTFSEDCNSSGEVTMVASSTKVCLITNEEKPSKLRVNKTVINHGNSKVVSDFSLLVDSNPVTSGALNIFDSGLHIVSEVLDAEYEVAYGGDCDSGGSVTLVPNTTKTCSVTNEEKLAYVVVNKNIINHGGTAVNSDFAPYKVGATTVTLGVTTTKNSGTYTVSETVDPAYTQTFSGDCNGAGSITLVGGTTKTCTITNEENLVVPIVTTPTAVFISTSSATLGANVISPGVPHSITARGTCYSISPNPTLTNGATCLAEGGTALGIFTQIRTGLIPATTYYYAGYATNSTGTGYSADGTFTTLANSCTGTPWGTMLSGTSNTGYLTSSVTYPSTCTSEIRTCTNGTLSGSYTNTSCSVTPIVPTVTTVSPVTSITRTTAIDGGNVTSDGGASVTARGVVWSTSINPTIALPTKTSDGTGTGSFTSSLTSLTCNTLYYIKAYATNSAGTAYGSQVTFTTAVCSTISYVGQATSNTTSVTLPTHNVGDLMIVFAYRSSNNTVPTVPAGWTTINSSSGANNSSVQAYRIATGSDTATGWTNATQLVALVYRGVSTTSPIGTVGVPQQANSKIVTYPALALSVTNGTSWVVGSAGAASIISTLETPPVGMTLRNNVVGASAEASGFDTNGGVSSWTAKTVTISAGNVKWSSKTLEIKSQ